jgi:MEMO1 family protein
MQSVQTSIYAKLASLTTEHFVKYHEYLPLEQHLSIELTRQQACFVTILENPGRRVRALYGQALPQQTTLAHEIVFNTVQAILSNSARRISRPDLSHLEYRIALLGPLQRISDPTQLDPAIHGLLVQSDRNKFALLLPGRTGVETGHDQVATALREASLNSKQEVVTMYRFDVEHYDE